LGLGLRTAVGFDPRGASRWSRSGVGKAVCQAIVEGRDQWEPAGVTLLETCRLTSRGGAPPPQGRKRCLGKSGGQNAAGACRPSANGAGRLPMHSGASPRVSPPRRPASGWSAFLVQACGREDLLLAGQSPEMHPSIGNLMALHRLFSTSSSPQAP